MVKTNMHQIHDDIPVPKRKRKHGYWAEKAKSMLPGHYIEVKERSDNNSLYNAMSRMAYEITSETEDKLIRVWRVK